MQVLFLGFVLCICRQVKTLLESGVQGVLCILDCGFCGFFEKTGEGVLSGFHVVHLSGGKIVA